MNSDSTQRTGAWQHFVAQLHQRQFSITTVVKDNRPVTVYNHANPDTSKKGVPSGITSTNALFSANYTYDDKHMSCLRGDSVVSEEERIFVPFFKNLNAPPGELTSSNFLAKLIAHNVKKSIHIRDELVNQLNIFLSDAVNEMSNNENFEKATFKLFSARHQHLNKMLSSVNSGTSTNELFTFACFLTYWVSCIDYTVALEGEQSVFLKFKEGLSILCNSDFWIKHLKFIKEFIKMGHISGLLESKLDSSDYVKSLETNFHICLSDFSEASGCSFILPDNPVCFIIKDGLSTDTFRYCSKEDLSLIDYIILPITPYKAILCVNKMLAGAPFDFKISTINSWLATVASNNYISNSEWHKVYLSYINKSKFSPSPLITESDKKELSSLNTYLSLENLEMLKQELLTKGTDSDKKHFEAKIMQYFKEIGILSPSVTPPFIVNALESKNSSGVSVFISGYSKKCKKSINNPKQITVRKNSTIEFFVDSLVIKGLSNVKMYIFNTGISAIPSAKKNIIYEESFIKSLSCEELFSCSTEGLYPGNHLAILVGTDLKGNNLLINKILVNVKRNLIDWLLFNILHN